MITSALHYAIHEAAPADTETAQMASIMLPETDQRYVPDLVVLPKQLMREEIWKFPAEAALLVVEVTSPGNAQTDRVTKLRGYARSHVPSYLLVDREDRTVTLFTEPSAGIYRRDCKVPFGAKLTLPEPFTGRIDTGEFE